MNQFNLVCQHSWTRTAGSENQANLEQWISKLSSWCLPWYTLIIHFCHTNSYSVNSRDQVTLTYGSGGHRPVWLRVTWLSYQNYCASALGETELWVKVHSELSLILLFSKFISALLIRLTFPLSLCDGRSSKAQPLRPKGKQPEHCSVDCTNTEVEPTYEVTKPSKQMICLFKCLGMLID